MAILNHFYTLTIPFVLLLSLPLFLTALITTSFALSLLLLRVIFVYMDLLITVIPYYLSPFPHLSPSRHNRKDKDSLYASASLSPSARRRRRSSSVSLSMTPVGLSNSALSSNSLTPVASSSHLVASQPVSNLKPSVSSAAILSYNTPYNSLMPSLAISTRDFEGVGGWRLGSSRGDNDNDDSDALWTKINSRLELPAEHGRRHKRSLTGGSNKYRDASSSLLEGTPRSLEREDSGLVGWGSGARSVREVSPAVERERVIAGGAAWEREREGERERERDRENSNVGKSRTPMDGGSAAGVGGYFGAGHGMSGSTPTSPRLMMKNSRREREREREREASAHTVVSVASTSSGSSRGSGLIIKQKG